MRVSCSHETKTEGLLNKEISKLQKKKNKLLEINKMITGWKIRVLKVKHKVEKTSQKPGNKKTKIKDGKWEKIRLIQEIQCLKEFLEDRIVKT